MIQKAKIKTRKYSKQAGDHFRRYLTITSSSGASTQPISNYFLKNTFHFKKLPTLPLSCKIKNVGTARSRVIGHRHSEVQYTKEAKPGPPKEFICIRCRETGHKQTECQKKLCNLCKERSHIKSTYPQKLLSSLWSQRRHLIDQCPEGPAEFPSSK